MTTTIKTILIFAFFFVLVSGTINLENLENYEDQIIPEYVTRDNTGMNEISDEGATLGRVLFYDKNLSTDKSIACASCHSQEFAFSDTSQVSTGVNGVTGRHSMRLVNARFADETKFFWDERAATLEEQVTMPIQDHAEMGYSGQNGDPSLEDLMDELEQLDYYNELFTFVYGDPEITEPRMRRALAQFIRSIQSFDSKYDEGRAQVTNYVMPFPNFTASENRGKMLFTQDPVFGEEGNRVDGGIGCASCHRAPDFSIDPLSRTNGVVEEVDGSFNFTIHRAPSLRDMINPSTGLPNGQFMHNGAFETLEEVLDHYNNIGNDLPTSIISQLDPRLRSLNFGQKLNMTATETEDVLNFLMTLTGTDIYTNPKWSDPFDQNGNIEITDSPLSIVQPHQLNFQVFPNPATDYITISNQSDALKTIELVTLDGQILDRQDASLGSDFTLDVSPYPTGIYLLKAYLQGKVFVHKLMINR